MEYRTLPSWMSNRQKQGKDAQSLTAPLDKNTLLPFLLKMCKDVVLTISIYKKNIVEDDLPYLNFSGTIIYSKEKDDCSFVSEDLRSCLDPSSAVGFDLEWPPSFIKGKKKKVALVQLCASEEKCYLFHLSSMSGFPPGLKTFLEDDTIQKVGVGIEGDMWRLLADFEVQLKNFVELTDMANEKLRCVEKWSLDGLAKHLLKQQLLKDKVVRCSQWDDFDLTEEQKRYAAADAYAGWRIFKKLKAMGSSCEMEPSINLKQRLLHIANEIEGLAVCIPDVVSCTDSRVEMLVEDMSQNIMSLRDLLKSNDAPGTVKEPDFNTCMDQTEHHNNPQTEDHATDDAAVPKQSSAVLEGHDGTKIDKAMGPEPLGGVFEHNYVKPAQQECMMSLDITECELQMLERQAGQEDMEEQSTLQSQERVSSENSAYLSYEIESEEELEDEMLQYVDLVEQSNGEDGGLHHGDQNQGQVTGMTEDDDEDSEEEEEEGMDMNLPQPNPEQIRCLKMYFGHHSFKPVQWKVIHSVLEERKDNLVVMATGYGKSLCFQFPPVHCVNISVVISPLIALMEDQVLQLQMSNIPACFLGSAQTKDMSSELKRGCFRVVYMTPEFCSGNVPLLEELSSTIGISLIAVDEAHCISQWGHDFRAAYRNLGKLKKSLPDVPIVALTATASPSIREDIMKSLNLSDPIITCTSFDRPNLYLEVNRKSGDLFQDLKSCLVARGGGGYKFEGSAIVYCPTKKEAERVASALSKLGISCGVYHGGLGIPQRRETQHQFMRDEIQCVVATIAFGMGINKSDIRTVIHYGAPKEMESYYQEIGRAGRDGLPSVCHVLWTSSDMALIRFLLNQSKSARFRNYKMDMMTKMEKYLNSTRCRRKMILSHFEDKQVRKVTSGIMGTSRCCDNCKAGPMFSLSKEDSKEGLQDFGLCAYQLMGAIRAMGERFGITAPILLLRGSMAQRIPDRFRRLPLFGAGRNVPEAWWKALGRELIMEKYLMEASGQNKFATLCKLTPTGKAWLSKAEDESQRSLMLQPNRDLNARVCVQRESHDPTPSTQNNPSPESLQTSRLCPRVDATQMFKTADSLSSKAAPGPPCVTVSKPQPPAVSPREMEIQTELYGQLVAERQKLASQRDIPPAILATNKILLDMAKLRPCTVSSLMWIDGVSEARAAMLAPLLQTITHFCQTHKLQVDEVTSSAPSCPAVQHTQPANSRDCTTPLSDSVYISYRLFQMEGKSIRQVADARSLPVTVVESHLLQAQKANHPLDTERAGLSAATFSRVSQILSSPPLSSDFTDLKAIRVRVPEEISMFLLRLTVTKLQREGFPTQRPCPAPAQHHISWIEPRKETSLTDRPMPPPIRAVRPQSEQDLMDSEDEDELFRQIPMPEDMGPTWSLIQANSDPMTSSKSVPPSGMELVSRNQKNLDEDTQALFSDSPVKNVSQPHKRKLPEWAEASKGASTSDASSRKTKPKKGLFM